MLRPNDRLRSLISYSTVLRHHTVNSMALVLATLAKIIYVYWAKWRRVLFYQRSKVIKLFYDSDIEVKKPRVIVAIAHITSPQEAECPTELGSEKVERLQCTIDGLLSSFAHCNLTITIHTLPGRHVVRSLPVYQRQLVQVIDSPDCNPMFVEYRLQDALIDCVEDYDWFLMIEDDIVISDSLFLEKLSKFNQISGGVKFVLTPNRYEMYEGRKSYIDLTICSDCAWDSFSLIESDGVKFAECVNPHSAMYCLSQDQVRYWIQSGRTWKNQLIMVGPLESAATFCLLECFCLYKPHPKNLNYLEVRHYDTKYSKQCPDSSPFVLSACSTYSNEVDRPN